MVFWLGGDVDDHVFGKVRRFGGVAQAHLMGVGVLIDVDIRAELPAHGNGGMVAQIFTHTGQILDNGYVQALKVFGGTDAGSEQEMGRADGTGAEDDVWGFKDFEVAVVFDFNTCCTGAVEQDAADVAIGADSEVGTVSCWVEVGEGGADADAVLVVEWERSGTGGFGMVHIRTVWKASGTAGSVKGLLVRAPVFRCKSADGDGAVCAVPIVRKIQVGFEFFKVGENGVEGPLVVAKGDPAFKVFGQAAQEDLGVYGTGAAGNTAARERYLWSLIGQVGGVVPVMAVGQDAGRGTVTVFEVLRERFECGIVWAGFEEEDGAVRVLGEAGGQNGASRACTDEDEVGHGGSQDSKASRAKTQRRKDAKTQRRKGETFDHCYEEIFTLEPLRRRGVFQVVASSLTEASR